MEIKSNRIGWCHSILEGSVIYEPPEKVAPPKDRSPRKTGFLSCPAVKSTLAGVYVIRSPYNLRLRFGRLPNGDYTLSPVYPYTTIAQGKLAELVRLEPFETWQSPEVPVIQIPSPYLFASDEHVDVEQYSPSLLKGSLLNWRVIPGRFDIYAWQRPLNWAFEWDTRCGDFVIRQGDPLYFVRFYDSEGRVIANPDLFEMEMTQELKDRVSRVSGVSGMRKGLASLIRKESAARTSSIVKEKTNLNED